VLLTVEIDDVSADDVARAVEDLVPTAAPVRPLSALRTGRNHVSWVLSSARGRLVGKVATHPHDTVVLDRLAEHQRIWEFDVPVPRLLAFTSASSAAGGRVVIVAEYLPGADAEEVLQTLLESQAGPCL
jgi:hypothetical protein